MKLLKESLTVYNKSNIESIKDINLDNSNEIGLHVGSKEAANKFNYKHLLELTLDNYSLYRLNNLNEIDWSSLEVIDYMKFLDIDARLELKQELRKASIEPNKRKIYSDTYRKVFLDAGYNLVEYNNYVEDKGSLSYIILDKSIIKNETLLEGKEDTVSFIDRIGNSRGAVDQKIQMLIKIRRDYPFDEDIQNLTNTLLTKLYHYQDIGKKTVDTKDELKLAENTTAHDLVENIGKEANMKLLKESSYDNYIYEIWVEYGDKGWDLLDRKEDLDLAIKEAKKELTTYYGATAIKIYEYDANAGLIPGKSRRKSLVWSWKKDNDKSLKEDVDNLESKRIKLLDIWTENDTFYDLAPEGDEWFDIVDSALKSVNDYYFSTSDEDKTLDGYFSAIAKVNKTLADIIKKELFKVPEEDLDDIDDDDLDESLTEAKDIYNIDKHTTDWESDDFKLPDWFREEGFEIWTPDQLDQTEAEGDDELAAEMREEGYEIMVSNIALARNWFFPTFDSFKQFIQLGNVLDVNNIYPLSESADCKKECKILPGDPKEASNIFNKNMGAEASEGLTEARKFLPVQEIVDIITPIVNDFAKERYLDDYVSIQTYKSERGNTIIHVGLEAGYRTMDKLCDILNAKLEPLTDSYFEPADAGIIEAAVFDGSISIREALKEIDLADNEKYYDLTNMYESVNLVKEEKEQLATMIVNKAPILEIYNFLEERLNKVGE